MTKSITIQIPVQDLTKGLIKDVNNLCTEKDGSHKFKVMVIDKSQEVSLLLNHSKLIHVDSEFIDHLSRLGLAYKLN